MQRKVLQIGYEPERDRLTWDGWDIHCGQGLDVLLPDRLGGGTWQAVSFEYNDKGWYKAHARPIEEIPYDRVNKGSGRKYQSEVYICRKDEAGRKLDKAAMLVCSKALGHNRISVVADNYIRGL